MATLKREEIKRLLDECACDWCEQSLEVGDVVFIDLEHGTAFCTQACAEHDAFDRGYGPVCPGVSYW